jgi:2-polyprenyl-3-methyl-5-hydroxy-6-metoxy-1,4-benzoquinol methylase
MKKSLAYDIYNNRNFVRQYALRIGNPEDNSFYERNATLGLLPEVKNKKVLDAGCGPGIYSEWLLNQGAEVTGIDYSIEMIHQVKSKFGEKIKLHTADLNQPLTFIANAEFDLILCTMVLLHIEDWQPVFSEFHRVLKSNGILVFSTVHPFADYLEYAGNYFATELIEEEWPEYNIVMPAYRRSLGSIFTTLIKTGFYCEDLIEPKPETENINSGFESAFSNQPWFICIKAKKNL